MKLKLTKRQVMLLIIYNIGFVLSGFCYSIQGPFYPSEAAEKGVSPSQYGFVFGVYSLTAFLFSPISAKLISQVGAILTSYLGLFIAGVTSTLFGLLHKMNGAELFFTFSLIIRIMEAIGTTTFRTAGFSIIANEFPDNRATAFASLQSCIGLGIIIGPTVGGVLYQWKGYLAPFLIIGILLILAAVFSAILLSGIDETSDYNQPRKGLLLLLQQPEILLGIAATFGAYMNISFYQSTFEPHIRSFQLSPVKLGLMFIISGATHSVAAPVWGIICDKCTPLQFVWSTGAILVSISLLLLGPAPYFPFQLSIPLCIIALIIHAIGQAAEIVSAFCCFSRIAVQVGFPDDVKTYCIVSALFSSVSSLGSFVGPTLGGFLFQYIGFPWAVHVLIFFHMLLFILTLFYNSICTENKFSKHEREILSDIEKKSILANEKIPCYSKFSIGENKILPDVDIKSILPYEEIPYHTRNEISNKENKTLADNEFKFILPNGEILCHKLDKFPS